MSESLALVVAEHDGQDLKPATASAVNAARQCAGQVHVLVAGQDCIKAAEAAARLDGVTQVWLADGPALAHDLAETLAAQTLGLAARYQYILAAASMSGKNFLPRVAALLDVAPLTDVIAVDAPNIFRRTLYAGNIVATIQCDEPVKVLTIRATAFDPVGQTTAASAPITSVDPVPAAVGTRFISREVAKSVRPELASATAVVAGGRGLGSADNFKLLEALADKLGAALGASRAAVDAGYAPNDWQIGQTGKIVAPQLYIAVGISGAVQHLAGMKDAKVIVAINKDPDAPIFQVADYGLTGDLFEILPALTAAL